VDFYDYLKMLDKPDVALLYRVLRDKIMAQPKEASQQDYTVLGKLKVILNG
jgi:hypothetical protein